MLCYRCGSHNPDGSAQCSHCGESLGKPRASASPAVAEPTRTRVVEPPFEAGVTFAERYVLEEFLGAGPLGFVYRAEDKDLSAEVALKLVPSHVLRSSEERRHFLGQVKQARQFAHAQLARVYEEGEHDGWTYIVMPYLSGRTLRSVLERKRGHFTLGETVAIVGQVAAALSAAHTIGPHGDVKPENIFLLPDALKLTDFGMASGTPRPMFVELQRSSQAGAYLAPEVVSGEALDVRDDVFALGVLLGEVLAGVLPSDNTPSLSSPDVSVAPGIEALYRKCLSPVRGARPPTPAEFAQELAKAAEISTPPPLPAELTAPARTPPPPPVASRETKPPSPPVQSRPDLTERIVEAELVEQQAPSKPRGAQPVAHEPLPPPVPTAAESHPGWEVVSAARTQQRLNQKGQARAAKRRRFQSMLSLVWIALAGLGIGAAGGWFVLERWLERLRTQPVAHSPADARDPGQP